MRKMTTCLWFDDQGEEAASFYTSIFENSRIVRIARYGEAGPGAPGSVMTVDFELDGREFVALNGGPQFTFSEAVSIQVYRDTQEEIDRLWSALGAGGRESDCGWLTDRCGLSWQVIPNLLPELISDPDPVRSQRVVRAMLGMGKLDTAGLQRAYDGD